MTVSSDEMHESERPSARPRLTEEDWAHLRALVPQSLGFDTLRLFVGDREAIQLVSGDEGIIRFEVTVGRVPEANRPSIDALLWGDLTASNGRMAVAATVASAVRFNGGRIPGSPLSTEALRAVGLWAAPMLWDAVAAAARGGMAGSGVCESVDIPNDQHVDSVLVVELGSAEEHP